MVHSKNSPETESSTATAAFSVSKEECFATFTGEYRKYQEDAIAELLDNFKKGNDVALNLPTGTGKTIVFLSVAIALADLGYRVAILVATNQILDQIKQKYLPMFRMKTFPAIVKGIEHYICRITGENADYGTCTPEQKELCSTSNPNCDVLQSNKAFEEHGFVLTNFHKFLSMQDNRGFDLVIIDDSHGFENALDDKFQSRVSYYQMDGLFKRHDQAGDIVADFAGAFLDFFDDAFNTIPLDKKYESMRVPNDIIKKIAEIDCYDDLHNQIKKLDELDRSICRGVSYFVKCCQNSSVNKIYIQKDHYNLENRQEAALIARKSDKYQRSVVKKKFRKPKLVLASATLGDIVTHANCCTFKEYDENTISTVPKTQPDAVRKWFDGLRIFETKDSPEATEDQIEKAAEMALEILKRTQGKTLLLFKSYRDQERARKILENSINRKITFIDDSFQSETVQKYVEQADIIMASASSRLWEGIDISDLKLEIIFSLPFIRPPVHLEKSAGFFFSRRKMLIRLQQGIGRLIRKEDDKGLCIILDKRLEKYKNSANFSEAFREKIQFVSFEELLEKLKRN